MATAAHANGRSAPVPLKGYKPVPVSALKAAEATHLDLYILGEDRRTPLLFRGSEFDVTAEDLERLERKGTRWLYVDLKAHRKLRSHLQENLAETVHRQDLAPAVRHQLLQVAVEAEIENAFQQIHVDAAVAESRRVGAHLVGVLDQGQAVPQSLFRVMRHDYYTFTHLINVSTYAVLLAERLGIRDQAELEEIAMGGLVHDVGKRRIPVTILNKPGRLTDEEFDVIRSHPQHSFEDLSDRDDVTWGQLMMAYQHHERIDGSGYPVGAVGEEIHPWGRLCAVVDVFDALTSTRPYRKAKPLPDVLEFLESVAGRHLDTEMVRCWTSAMRESQPASSALGSSAT